VLPGCYRSSRCQHVGCSFLALLGLHQGVVFTCECAFVWVFFLQARGCPLRSVLSVPTPAAQAQRLQATGWASAAAADMAVIYYASSSSSSTQSTSGNSSSLQLPGRQGPPAAAAAAAAGDAAGASAAADDAGSGWLRPSWQVERQRIERLELLDELEEWKLLQVGGSL